MPNDQPPLLSVDESRVFCAVMLLEPCTENTLIARLIPMLPVNVLHSALLYLSERRLIVETKGIGHRPYWATLKSWAEIYPTLERVILPVMEENRLLRQRDAEQKDIASRYLEQLRAWQSRFGVLSPDELTNIEIFHEDENHAPETKETLD